ncbi:MAG: type II toxin-antitoxin system prevent-host-death family antitoxin [Bacilli bacterium]|nr:type II toxin-antitoxin system prevent-host-death family antitoxin [Bacilli bacterium]
MCVITSTEFKNNYGKYAALAEKEEIQVTKHGVLVFTIIPAAKSDVALMQSFFGILPSDATIGVDPDERG